MSGNVLKHTGTATRARPASKGAPPPDTITDLSCQNSVYRRVIAQSDEIASAALQGADALTLADVLSRLLGKTVILLDPDFKLHACHSPDGDGPAVPAWDQKDQGVRRLLSALVEEGRPLRVPVVPGSVLSHGCLATPIAIGEQKLGYLLILPGSDSSDDEDGDLLLASYAATLFALTLAKERTMIDFGRRHQATIVDALVSGHFFDLDDAHRKAASLGLAAEQPFRIGVVRAHGSGMHRADDAQQAKVQQLVDGLAATMPQVVHGAAAFCRGTDLVMLLPEQPGADRLQGAGDLNVLAAFLAKHNGGVRLTCGLSDLAHRPDLAPRSLRQAECAVDVGVRIGRVGQLVRYDELGIYRLLLQIGNLRQLGRFADEILGPLVRYDAAHRSELVRTLSVFLSEHASLKQAARRLHVHANTVAYRIGRVEQLTQLDLSDSDDRLTAHVAVKILASQRRAAISASSHDLVGVAAHGPHG